MPNSVCEHLVHQFDSVKRGTIVSACGEVLVRQAHLLERHSGMAMLVEIFAGAILYSSFRLRSWLFSIADLEA